MTDTHNTLPLDTLPLAVVVAEDEALLRLVATELLAEQGFVAIEAEGADAAVTAIESRPEDIAVLFTDVQMPGSMDGVALARYVRERWPSIAVVVASGNLSVNTEELPPGARFLSKPYDMGRVIALIRELCPRS